MPRYRVEYYESMRRVALIDAESESAARQAFIDQDVDDDAVAEDVEVDSGPVEIIDITVVH